MKKVVHILFEKLKMWHFLVLFITSVPLTATLLRQNNLNAVQLRDDVLQVDEETGDIAKVAPVLEEYRRYVFNHMNTDLGTIELPGTFNTAVEKLRLRAQQSGSANGEIYAEAQRECEDPNILLTARAQCVQDYVIANSAPGSDAISEIDFPDKSLFSYSFASPRWSPDLAGFSLLFSALSFTILSFLILTRGIAPLLARVIDRDPLE